MLTARARRVPVLALALALAAAGLACKRREPDINGIGPYVLGKMKLADARSLGRCMPVPDGPESQCLIAREIPIGEQPAEVQLYFRGQAADDPLVEINLEVRACREKETLAKLVSLLGEPTEQAERRRIWTRKHAFILGNFRRAGTSCEIYFIDPKDTARIAELRAEK